MSSETTLVHGTSSTRVRKEGRKTGNAGISLPFTTQKILDDLRGDIPKGLFTRRLIESAYKEKQQLVQAEGEVKRDNG